MELLLLVVLSGYILAGLTPFISRAAGKYTGWILALLPLAIAGYLASLVGPVLANHGDPIEVVIEWVPSLGVNLSFYVDGLSLMMGLLVSGMGALIFIYGQGYLDDDERIGRFFMYLLIFMAAMLGLVLSGNLITLFIFWEITSISSYLLIGYKHKYKSSRDAALQALLITGSGGLVLLAGLVLVGTMGGSFEFAELLSQKGALTNHALYAPALILVLIGCFTKSAQAPFHTWLPGAMAAPTPVSAYLHSATMVKAGIYLLARLTPILGGTALWFNVVTTVGVVTMLMGAFLSWQNVDLKRILAYSTISVLGTLTMLLGMGADYVAIKALIIFLLSHAFYKGSLFMIAGAIDHSTGTRDITQLSGLRRELPLLFFASIVAAFSKMGLPFFLGFIGKELVYEATLHSADNVTIILTLLAVIANAMVGVAAALVVIKPFLGDEVRPHHIHKPSLALRLGPLVLSVLTLALGIVPGLLDYFTIVVVKAITTKEVDVHLVLYHEGSLTYLSPLWLSVITIALLAVIYQLRPRLLGPLLPLRGDRWGAQNWYQWTLDGVRWFAEQSTLLLQNGNLRYYLMTIMTGLLVISGGTLLVLGFELPVQLDLETITLAELVACIIIIVSAAFATRFESRLAAIAALGGIGFGVSVLFMLLGAPDLAMTQISIEILSVVLIALIMGRLPYFLTNINMADRTITTFIAGATGVLITLLVLIATSNPAPSLVTPWYAEFAEELAHGRNIVNVILVDFRGFDTLGEITVLAVAGLGVYSFSRLRVSARSRRFDAADAGQSADSEGN